MTTLPNSTSHVGDAVLREVGSAHRWQTSAKYLSTLSRTCLADLLGASTKGTSTPADVARISALIHDMSIKSFAYKSINSATFWTGAVLMLLSIFWPALNQWGRWTTNTTTAGTLQSILTAAAAFSLTLHRQYKKRQTQVEDALRRTLFVSEGIEAKVARLIDLMPSIDTGADFGSAAKSAATENPKTTKE